MNLQTDSKTEIIRKYDEEARELDTKAWLDLDSDVRVPEPGSAHYFVGRKVAMALGFCKDKSLETADVLEIGCSFGQMTGLLAEKFPRLTAVDISPKSVEVAEKRLKAYNINHVMFSVDDAESLSTVADNSFDIVFSFSTLRFCPHPEVALKAISRKLRPGGIAIVDFPNRNSPWHRTVKPLLGIKPHIHDRLFTPDEAVGLFKGAGLTVAGAKCFLFTGRRLPSPLVPAFAAIDFVLERIPLVARLAGIIMVKGIRV